MAAISSDVPIEVFYTICTDYDYAFVIFEEQMKRLEASGLAEAMKGMTITVVGERPMLYQHLPFGNKVKIITTPTKEHGERACLFEILRMSQNYDFHALYFHCKGCTHPVESTNISDWRYMMEYFLLDHWRQARELLTRYDTIGVNQGDYPTPHYSGNFWWARSSYLRHLPNPNDRFLAFYTQHTLGNYSERHQRFLKSSNFDPEFVKLTYPPGSTLPFQPNLSEFIAKYGVDWIWYTSHYIDARGLTAEQAVKHWNEIGISKGRDSDYKSFYERWERINSEAWILRGAGSHHSLYNSNCCHYKENHSRELYDNPQREIVALFFPTGLENHERYRNTPEREYRVFVNITGGNPAATMITHFSNYWNIRFTHLLEQKQVDYYLSYLQSQYKEVIVVQHRPSAEELAKEKRKKEAEVLKANHQRRHQGIAAMKERRQKSMMYVNIISSPAVK